MYGGSCGGGGGGGDGVEGDEDRVGAVCGGGGMTFGTWWRGSCNEELVVASPASSHVGSLRSPRSIRSNAGSFWRTHDWCEAILNYSKPCKSCRPVEQPTLIKNPSTRQPHVRY